MKSYRQIFTHNPLIGHKYINNLKTIIVGEIEDQMLDYTLIADKFGYRNENLELDQGQSKIHVDNLFIGCSFTAGDGVSNKSRFSDILGNSYNAGISGTDIIQQYLISKDCSEFIEPKRVIFSPYIGCVVRNFMKKRQIDNLVSSHLWHKPYPEIKDGEMILHNIPVPKPHLEYTSNTEEINQTSFFKQLIRKLSNKGYSSDMNKNIEKAYSSPDQFKVTQSCFEKAKSLFPNSTCFIAPIPNWDFLKHANKDLKFLVQQFYLSICKTSRMKYIDILNCMLAGEYNQYFYIEGHLNASGHIKLADVFAKEFR